MAEKATISPSYRRQLILMGVFVLFWSLYFLYDGYIGYPHKRMIAQEFSEFQNEGRVEAWFEYARAREWPDGTEGDPGYNYSGWDIRTQKIIGYGLLPIALLYCFSFARSFGKWIAIDAEGLATSWGRRFAFGEVTELNKQRWQTKGIAVVHYREGSRTQKLVLDSYKFDRRQIAGMVETIESHISGGEEGHKPAG